MKSLLNKIKTAVKKTFSIYSEAQIPVYSGYVTVFILSAAIPMLVMIMTVLNRIPYFTSADFAELLKHFLPDLPQVQTLITNIIGNLNKQSSLLLTSVAAVTTLWSASAGIAAIQRALVSIDREAEGSIYDRPKAILFTILFTLVMIGILGFQLLGDVIQDIIEQAFEQIGVADKVSTLTNFFNFNSLLTLVGAFVVLLCAYTYLPAGKRSIKKQIPGTVFSGIIFLVFSALFAYFIKLFWHSSAIYGSLASLFLITLWLRFTVMIILCGAAFNRALLETEEEAGAAAEAEAEAEAAKRVIPEVFEDEYEEEPGKGGIAAIKEKASAVMGKAGAVKDKVSGAVARVKAAVSKILSFVKKYKWLIVAAGTAAGVAGAYFGVKTHAADKAAGKGHGNQAG
ncbi:MAG: YihY/virulence factor BrkB family protein [Lachnospiraceae bacterium]|nr:YihY/virulence factor BrkB family protein [Lachnospiraceae bacterium]